MSEAFASRPAQTTTSGGAKARRGFAAMDQDMQREIASAGGRAAHQSGRAHEYSSAEAQIAGQKGGKAVSQDRQHMAAIGRKGGLLRHSRQVEAAAR